MEPCKILMIDDSAELRRVLRMAFDLMTEYQLLEAGSLAAGRALLEAETPDLLLLDAELPDGSGFDFCREVRLHSDIPILLSSGLAARERIAEGYAAGCSDYLVKPYLLDTLLERIEALRGYEPRGPCHPWEPRSEHKVNTEGNKTVFVRNTLNETEETKL